MHDLHHRDARDFPAAQLRASPFELRLAEATDEPFLVELYTSTHGQQFALLPLAPAELDTLLRMQFNAQRTGYRQQYPQSQDFIIMVDGKAGGRVWLNESATEVLVVDIAVLPQHQGRGYGTAVLQQLIDDARRTGRTVRLHVDRMNVRAAQLYRRLGFQVRSENEIFEEMELAPR